MRPLPARRAGHRRGGVPAERRVRRGWCGACGVGALPSRRRVGASGDARWASHSHPAPAGRGVRGPISPLGPKTVCATDRLRPHTQHGCWSRLQGSATPGGAGGRGRQRRPPVSSDRDPWSVPSRGRPSVSRWHSSRRSLPAILPWGSAPFILHDPPASVAARSPENVAEAMVEVLAAQGISSLNAAYSALGRLMTWVRGAFPEATDLEGSHVRAFMVDQPRRRAPWTALRGCATGAASICQLVD